MEKIWLILLVGTLCLSSAVSAQNMTTAKSVVVITMSFTGYGVGVANTRQAALKDARKNCVANSPAGVGGNRAAQRRSCTRVGIVGSSDEYFVGVRCEVQLFNRTKQIGDTNYQLGLSTSRDSFSDAAARAKRVVNNSLAVRVRRDKRFDAFAMNCPIRFRYRWSNSAE